MMENNLIIPRLFGVASVNSTMPGILTRSNTGIAHFEAIGSLSTTAATVQFQGSISGQNWSNVGSALTFTSGTGNVAQFVVNTSVNYNFYRCVVSGLSSGSISAWMGN
jgi:ABC-type transport system involved in cytochrome c biogenesis permease subunit